RRGPARRVNHDEVNIDELRAENAELRGEPQKSQRALRQAERLAQRSQAHSVQSKRAMLRTFGELERRVEELGAAKEAAEGAVAAKSRFLATMSHELRTPLNGMLGSADLLLSTRLQPDQREVAELLQRSGLALLSIVNDVLDFSRLEADRMPIERVAFNLERCVRDVVELQRHVAVEKQIELRTAFADGLPVSVLGDPGRLRQVLMNLVTNALKFTAEGFVEVRVTAGAGDAEVAFAVVDTGIGISQEAQANLFEAFSQADASTTRRFGGTGLGLAVSKRLVTLMGGEIRLESAPAAGSTFTFSCLLPAAAVEDTPVDAGPPAGVGGEPLSCECRRVLVVDDNPSNRLLVVRMLQRIGCESDVAVDGVEAVTFASSREYDLVLMDCSMPVMDGFDATLAIRALPGDRGLVPIVALTANSMPEDEARCREVGMNDYLTKPVRLAELVAAIERVTRLAAVG
ncbi:MAG: response regulator, partial [Planctomycetes bacterium]|nr:response regulator [Planctomycetota bacterium]